MVLSKLSLMENAQRTLWVLSPTSPIRPPLAVEKRLFRRESPYKSVSASPETAVVPTYPIAGTVIF
jgi:hypothetical protein